MAWASLSTNTKAAVVFYSVYGAVFFIVRPARSLLLSFTMASPPLRHSRMLRVACPSIVWAFPLLPPVHSQASLRMPPPVF